MASGPILQRLANLKRNYQLMQAIKWLRRLMNHLPDNYEHLGIAITIENPVVRAARPGSTRIEMTQPR
jgi:hypothetical protein